MGNSCVGGLVGKIQGGSIVNCYSTGIVQGSSYVGGLIGRKNGGSVLNSFWDMETSGQSSSAGGTGKTTEQMKNVRTYTDTSWSEGLAEPWDFVGNPYDDTGNQDIWEIHPDVNDGYPTVMKKYIFQNNPPVADFSYSPSSPTVDDVVMFVDMSTDIDGTIISWSWDFGDGSTSTLQNPTHQYSVAGTYTVTLTVFDNDGATDNTSQNITVSEATTPYVVYGDVGIPSGSDIWVWSDGMSGSFDGHYIGENPPEGSACFETKTNAGTWAGWGVFFVYPPHFTVDLSSYDYLKFWVKTPTNLKVEIEAPKGNTQTKWIGNYGWDETNTWQEIVIPASDFSNLSSVFCPFKVTVEGENTTFYIDHVRWTNVSPTRVGFTFYDTSGNFITNTPVRISLDGISWSHWDVTDNEGRIIDSSFPYPGMTVYFKPTGYYPKSKYIHEYSYEHYYDIFFRENTEVLVSFTFYDTENNYIANTPVYISVDGVTWELWDTTDGNGRIIDSDFPYLRRYVYFKPSGYNWKCIYIWSTGGSYSDTFTLEEPPEPPEPDKHAIIVTGTGTGQGVFEANAQRWTDYLEAKGYAVEYLHGAQATAAKVLWTIENVVNEATSAHTIVFVYLGHGGGSYLSGSSDPEYAYLCTYNSKLTDTELEAAFSNFDGKLFVFLGSCFSGGMDEVVTNAGPDNVNRYLTTTCGPNALGLFYDYPACPYDWSYIFLTKGLVNGESGSQDMEGNFSWAKSEYVNIFSRSIDYWQEAYKWAGISQNDDDWYPHQFDGDLENEFML
ncbi:MAG: hypothetical protein DRN83_04185 [Hadesarchaea archaeon]|nr:MAG: hypothetical protein DRN83_04185 [Hadesarchaea archaeon]